MIAPLPGGNPARPGRARDVFRTFLRLGLTSFGGPIAHVGYMRSECVVRRGWLDEARFAQLVALCQFLPGPASSQLGFVLGLSRAGWRGGLAAFIGFTLPSALAMSAFALLLPWLSASRWLPPVIAGLKLLAVAVVAHGVSGMARTLAPDLPRAAIAIATAALVLVVPAGAWLHVAAIALGAGAGLALCRNGRTPGRARLPFPVGVGTALWLLATWLGLLVFALALPPPQSPGAIPLFAAFYRAGSLVFGGGHVVLPLLHDAVVAPGWIDTGTFLAGYGAAQAVPGPMFTLAAYLGASLHGPLPAGVLATIALLAIFLPGLLLVAAALPLQDRLTAWPATARAMAGVNAAVVGLLAAAFYDPVWREGIRGPTDLLTAAVALLLLASRRVPVPLVVLWCVATSLATSAIG